MAISGMKQAGQQGLDLCDTDELSGQAVRYVFPINQFGQYEDHDAVIMGRTDKRVKIADQSTGGTVRFVKAHNLFMVGGAL
jgi:hypothetical protein